MAYRLPLGKYFMCYHVCVSLRSSTNKRSSHREKWPSMSPDPSLTYTLSINWLRQSKQEIEKAAGEAVCVHVCLWVGGTQQGGGHGYFGMPKMKEINELILQICEVCPRTPTSSLLLFCLSGSLQCHFILLSFLL